MLEGRRANPSLEMVDRLTQHFGLPRSYFLGDAAGAAPTPLDGAPVAGAIALYSLPLVGTVRAGVPTYAAEDVIGSVDTDVRGADFALVVRGDSMVSSGIVEGDVAICRQVDHVADVRAGSIVVALVNGDEATLKRLAREGDSWLLRADNPDRARYPDIACDEETHIRAVVLRVQRDLLPNGRHDQAGGGAVQVNEHDRLLSMLEEALAVSRIQAEANRAQAAANEKTASAAERAAAAAERIAQSVPRHTGRSGQDGPQGQAAGSE